jgi:hypothetical protein
LPDAYQ